MAGSTGATTGGAEAGAAACVVGVVVGVGAATACVVGVVVGVTGVSNAAAMAGGETFFTGAAAAVCALESCRLPAASTAFTAAVAVGRSAEVRSDRGQLRATAPEASASASTATAAPRPRRVRIHLVLPAERFVRISTMC
jgi:hypothetical protein